ncbi:hypothetical protein BGX20_007979 [Mortierella sp. AD010]|nr:hypothetical protein BGX20_007979 [Mortierella sp. AD010]
MSATQLGSASASPTNFERSGNTATSDPQGYTKSVNSINDEDSPLSPSMAWSREGTSEELSKYQELQMRQQNDGQHRPQAQGMATLLSDTTPLTVAQLDNSLVAKRAEADLYLKSTGGSIQEQPDQKHVDASGEKKSKSRIPSQSSSASTTTKRASKSSRTKVSTKTPEEGHRHGSDVSTTSAVTKSDRIESSSNNTHCQRQRSSGSSGKKTRCSCSSCQSDRSSTTPPQRSFRYGQFLGSGDPMPIYAGPMGLGDDIPSPTPSPPAPGRLSIHMAMSGRSPLSSPSSSPLMPMTRSSLPVLSPSSSSSKSPGRKSKLARKSPHEVPSGSDDHGTSNFNSPVSTHPVVTGFQSQTRDANIRSSKNSPSITTTPQPYLDATPLSTSPSSPSSPLYSSPLGLNFRAETEKDTSPSLSPFFMSTRSFSPEKQDLSPSPYISMPTSPPMRSDTLYAHNILQQSTSKSDSRIGISSLKQPNSTTSASASNNDFHRLAPPVVLIESPAIESLMGLTESSSGFRSNQHEDRNPLSYSSVIAPSSPSPIPSSSPISPSISPLSRSPTQQPFSFGGQHGTAATPPLSPSRKKEGNHHSTLSSLEKKDFEPWSLNEQIQERVARASSTLQYKSALLSGGAKDKTNHKQQQRQIQQPKVFSRHRSSNTHQQQSSSSTSLSNQTNQKSQTKKTPSVDANTDAQKWQPRGQSSTKGTTDPTPNNDTAPSISSDKKASDDRELEKPQSSQTSPKRPGNDGVSPPTLRRTRSAPMLASGQLSYADILKASIKATSSPSPSTTGNSPSSSLDLASSSNLSSSPSPLVSCSSASGTISPVTSATSTSTGGTSFKSRLVASLSPNRAMKSLRRSSLMNSRSDSNLKAKIDRDNMSAPLRSLLSSLIAVDASRKATVSVSGDLNEESPSGEKDTCDKRLEINSGKARKLDSNPEETIFAAENLDKRGLESNDLTQGRNDEPTPIQEQSPESSSGLSFFQPPEELGKCNTATLPENTVTAPMNEPEHATDKPSRSNEPDANPDPILQTETVSEQEADEILSAPPQVIIDICMGENDEGDAFAISESDTDTLKLKLGQMEQNSECPFQQQPTLQEQDDGESQHRKSNGSFKSHRSQINSSNGKKLHGSFQEQQAQQIQLESDGSNTMSSDGPKDYVIPPFYFPMGKPVAATERHQRVCNAVQKAKEIFDVAENGALAEDAFVAITVQCCDLPRYMNRALFRKVDIAGNCEVRLPEFERVWESLVETCPDEITMIFTILKQPGANVLTPSDFDVVLQDLILFHPGLEFLFGNVVFQERYCTWKLYDLKIV